MTETASDKFRKMAERIDHNKEAPFAGAAVIVFPSGQQGGIPIEPIDMLILDGSNNPSAFLATLKARLDMLIADMQDRERQLQSGFGRR
jgi:hypothetical protein